MVSMPAGVSVLVISSGQEADCMGAVLARTLLRQSSGASVQACPLRGQGEKYRRIDVPVVGVDAGLFGPMLSPWRRGRLLRHLRYRVNLVIVIGGLEPLLVAHRFVSKPTVFIPTFRLEGSRYFYLWAHGLRKCCELVFPQDEATAGKLREAKIPAVYLGNLLMDCIPTTNRPLNLHLKKVAAILPGSRSDAYDNIVTLAQLAHHLHVLSPETDFLVSIPSRLRFDRFAAALGVHGWKVGAPCPDELADGIVGKLVKSTCELWFFSGGIGDVIRTADLCLSMDPSAGEQAAGLGKPVVTLATERHGWRKPSGKKKEIARDPVIVIKSDAIAAARAAARILQDSNLYRKLSVAGRVKIGGQGAARRISETISALVRERRVW